MVGGLEGGARWGNGVWRDPVLEKKPGAREKLKLRIQSILLAIHFHGHFNRGEGEGEGAREDREKHLESLCVAATDGEGERVSMQNCRTSSSRRNDSLSSGVEVLDLLDDGLEGREPVSELVGNY